VFKAGKALKLRGQKQGDVFKTTKERIKKRVRMSFSGIYVVSDAVFQTLEPFIIGQHF